nr:hypothetical protein [Tanacetum cinerariifolium]
MNGKETSIMELHNLLQTVEQVIKKIDVPFTSATPVLPVGHNARKRKTSHSNWKGKATKGKSDRGSKRKAESEIAPTSDPNCFYCNTKGHWKRSCPKYLKDLKDGKVKKGSHSGYESDGPIWHIHRNGYGVLKGLEFGSIRRIQGIRYDVLEFLGVGTTFDIFQNNHILYLEHGVLSFSGYGVLDFIPLWSLMIEEKIKNTKGVRLRGLEERNERKECLQEVRNTKANVGYLYANDPKLWENISCLACCPCVSAWPAHKIPELVFFQDFGVLSTALVKPQLNFVVVLILKILPQCGVHVVYKDDIKLMTRTETWNTGGLTMTVYLGRTCSMENGLNRVFCVILKTPT